MENQLIVVAPDEVVDAANAAEIAARKPKITSDFVEIARMAALAYFNLNAVNVAINIYDALAAWGKARQSGLNVTQVSRTQSRHLIFPPGHPRDGVLYVAHPAMNKVYFVAATFHRLTFEHKVSEAIELLMNLGATEIRVEHVRGWSREFAAKISTPLSTGKASGNISQTESSQSSILYEAHLRGHAEPKIPNDLVWYPHEPTWQSTAKGRVNFGLKEFSLAVNYDDDFGINAGLKLTANKSGLDLGGNFEDHQVTTWKLHGKFADA